MNQRVRQPTLVLLKLALELKDPNATFFIVVLGSSSTDPVGKNHRYFYEEHECPWNILQLTTVVNGDNDRHGLFNHVKTILLPTAEEFALLTDGSEFDPDPDELLRQINNLSVKQLQRLFFSDAPPQLTV